MSFSELYREISLSICEEDASCNAVHGTAILGEQREQT